MRSNNQLHIEKYGGHYASIVAMLRSLHIVTKKLLHMNPIATQSAGKKP